MAITWSIIALLAVAGAYAVVSAPWNFLQSIFSGFSESSRGDNVKSLSARSLFAVLIVLLMVFNTGTAAAIALGGGAPSSVPLHPVIEADIDTDPGAHSSFHYDQDVSAYAWIDKHGDDRYGAFSDLDTRTAVNDAYSPHIAAAGDPAQSTSLDWRNDIFELPHFDGEAYVVFSSHNVNLNVGVPREGTQHQGQRDYLDLSDATERANNESRIFTTGDSEVYFLDG